jgi:hypothetical protein
MKSIRRLALACCLLLPACATLPPPVLPNSYILGGDGPRPTKMVYLRNPNICPEYYKDAVIELAYTLQPDGSVSNVRVVSADPSNCGFAGEAVYAFRKWKFPPYLENGVAVPHDAVYRLTFRISDLVG